MCEGVIGEQGPIVAHSLRSMDTLGQSGTLLCDALLGLCQSPAVNQYTFPIPKAAPSNPKVWKSSGGAPFKVLHFSDVHIDHQYAVSNSCMNTVLDICILNNQCRSLVRKRIAPNQYVAEIMQILTQARLLFQLVRMVNLVVTPRFL